MTGIDNEQPERAAGSGRLLVRQVAKAFGGRPVLSGVSFAVPPGGAVGFLGVNGAGKSTLFRILAGFERADAGSILLDEEELCGRSPSAICRRGMTTTFQQPLAVSGFSVQDVLRVAQSVPHRAAASQALRDIITGLVPREVWPRPLTALDGAMIRRVDLARALATRPQVVLLDEIFAGQDRNGTVAVAECIVRARRLGITFLIADHVPEMLGHVCDELHVLAEGRLALSGPPSVVIEAVITRRYYFGDSTGDLSS